jgi:hypothetical protein
MTVAESAELLIPRYIVIGLYPNCKLLPNYILYPTDEGKYKVEDNLVVKSSYLDTFPHLFRKLQWYEQRVLAEMPDYVKDNFDGEVYKVAEYQLKDNIVTVYLNEPNIYKKDGKSTAVLALFNPSNFVEFLEFKEKQESKKTQS